MQYDLQHAADFIYCFIRKNTANCSDSNNLFYPEKQKYLKKKKVKENSLFFLSQYENHRFKIAYIYCTHHLKHPEQHRWCHGKKQCDLSAIHTVCVGAKKQTVQ